MSSNSVTSTAREHVFPLFVKYVSANVLGMIGYSCYILADTFFVARGIGSDAIAALNLVLPAFSLLNGTGLMIGMGAAARYSLSSRRADSEIHRTIFTQALQLAFIAMLFFFSIGLLLQDLFVSYLEPTELHCRMQFHISASCSCFLLCFYATIC